MVDGGYDVADYRDVDPMFGSLADFDDLTGEAHRLGLKVIVDLVPNHSSSQHPWFVEALAAEPESAARDRYIFRAGRGPDGGEPPNDWESVFGGRAWTRVPDGQWYLHLFDSAQPDFNWRNPAVRAEFEDILKFWLDRGVDGFRIDVAHGMIKAEGLPDAGRAYQIGLLGRGILPYFDQDEVHDIYRTWRKILDSYPGDRMAIAETWASSTERLVRYVASDELHQVFNFDYLDAEWSPEQLRTVIDASLAAMAPVGACSTWVLSNHDKTRHVTRYGGDLVGTARARAALLLMLALPGSVYLYQGEELGLPEVTDLPADCRQDPVWRRSGGAVAGRDGCRVPMPWSGDEPPFGFGPGGSWLPLPASWAPLTVEAQDRDPGSMLNLYRGALAIRHEHPALGPDSRDALEWLDAPAGVLAFWRDPGLVCMVNFSAGPVEIPAEYGRVVCASTRLDGPLLPTDSAVWLAA
jgi:alpha-glucosidase